MCSCERYARQRNPQKYVKKTESKQLKWRHIVNRFWNTPLHLGTKKVVEQTLANGVDFGKNSLKSLESVNVIDFKNFKYVHRQNVRVMITQEQI